MPKKTINYFFAYTFVLYHHYIHHRIHYRNPFRLQASQMPVPVSTAIPRGPIPSHATASLGVSWRGRLLLQRPPLPCKTLQVIKIIQAPPAAFYHRPLEVLPHRRWILHRNPRSSRRTMAAGFRRPVALKHLCDLGAPVGEELGKDGQVAAEDAGGDFAGAGKPRCKYMKEKIAVQGEY